MELDEEREPLLGNRDNVDLVRDQWQLIGKQFLFGVCCRVCFIQRKNVQQAGYIWPGNVDLRFSCYRRGERQFRGQVSLIRGHGGIIILLVSAPDECACCVCVCVCVCFQAIALVCFFVFFLVLTPIVFSQLVIESSVFLFHEQRFRAKTFHHQTHERAQVKCRWNARLC